MSSPDSRTRILDAAERLIAERGIDVPLRDIAVAAEQRNNSAVQYHFGGRDGLIGTAVDRRMALLEARRMEMLAEHESTGNQASLRDLVSMLVIPLAEGQQEATHYCRFLEAVRNHPSIADAMQLHRPDRAAVRIITTRIDRALPELPAEVRARRLRALASAMFALLADYERERHSRSGRAAIDDIVDMLVGLLIAGVREPSTP